MGPNAGKGLVLPEKPGELVEKYVVLLYVYLIIIVVIYIYIIPYNIYIIGKTSKNWNSPNSTCWCRFSHFFWYPLWENANQTSRFSVFSARVGIWSQESKQTYTLCYSYSMWFADRSLEDPICLRMCQCSAGWLFQNTYPDSTFSYPGRQKRGQQIIVICCCDRWLKYQRSCMWTNIPTTATAIPRSSSLSQHWLFVWNIFYCSIYSIRNNNPNWLIFSEG